MAQELVVPEAVPNLPTFFMPRHFGSEDDVERRTYVLSLYRQFQGFVSSQELCGRALERVVDKAANLALKHTVLGPVLPGQKINGVAVEHEIDHLLVPKDPAGPSLDVEDKNMREWLNPSSEQIWSVIGNAVTFQNAIPILICRKMNFLGYQMFKLIGMMCWQVYDQYFDPSIELELLDIRHKDGLGFSDVTTDTEPPKALVRFFSDVVPENSSEAAVRFDRHRDLLARYAIEQRLDGSKNTEGKELNPSRRTQIYHTFLRELKAVEPSMEPNEAEADSPADYS